jgi:hypothetical protein
MKRTEWLLSSLLFSTATVAHTDSCKIQVNRLTQKIHQAEAAGNSAERSRLASALAEVQLHCTPLRQRVRAQDNIYKRQRQLQEVEQALVWVRLEAHEARQRGQVKKVGKLEDKIAEKENMVLKRQEALQDAYTALARLSE